MATDANGLLAGVIFDLDGVIVDTEHLWEEAWRSYCAHRGRRWTAEDTARVQGMSSVEWAQYISGLLGESDSAVQVSAECVKSVLTAVAAGHGPLLSGARELVSDVSDRIPVALASSAARPVISAVLAHHGLSHCFSATVSSEEVPRGKPSPDVYAEAARRIGVPVADGLAVEDSANGIRAAHAAGLHVVTVPNPQYPPSSDALALADYVADDHEAVRRYVLSRLPHAPPRR